MTTLDFFASEAAVAKRPSFFAPLRKFWTNMARRRAEHRSIMELSQLDAHLLRDMGIEPLDIYDALNGRTRSVLFNPVRKTEDHE
jgi:uncharacterized protein YjiS (DUF1127 family)